MNKKSTVVIISLSMLMSLSAMAARPSVSKNAANIETLKTQTGQLESDLSNIALTPGPQGEIGEAGVTGATGQDGADGVMYDGAFEGDMQYWNGNAWIMITAPAENADSLSFCDGQPTWTQGGCPAAIVYEVGDTGPAGGIVISVSNEGLNGIEAAPVDQGTAEWGCYGEIVPGTFSSLFIQGQANTDLIMAHNCGIDPTYGGVTMDAAILARSYTLGGYKDWYLPSVGEIVGLAESGAMILAEGEERHFWTSIQESHETAYMVEMYYPRIGEEIELLYGNVSKASTAVVRPFRSF
jgi:hypothetical protein